MGPLYLTIMLIEFQCKVTRKLPEEIGIDAKRTDLGGDTCISNYDFIATVTG